MVSSHFSLVEKQQMKRQFLENGYVMQRILSDEESGSVYAKSILESVF